MRAGRCVVCGEIVGLPDIGQPGRSESCEKCEADLHACRQCRHYDPHVSQACREPRAELVHEKARANFCGFYEFQGGSGEVDPSLSRADESKRKLESLFKKE